MARRKLSPLATILTIGAIGLTGFAVYKFIIKPYKDKKRAPIIPIDSIDADFVEVVDPNQA